MSYLVERFGDYSNYLAHCQHTAQQLGLSLARFREIIAVPESQLKQLDGYTANPQVMQAIAHADPNCGRCRVANLSDELPHTAETVYIGRATKHIGASPLANRHKLKGKSAKARDRACDADLLDLIAVLKSQKGDQWKEIKRLALLLRKGADINLTCYCAPLRCHGDGRAIAINSLARRVPVSDIIAELKRLLPAEQKALGGEHVN